MVSTAITPQSTPLTIDDIPPNSPEENLEESGGSNQSNIFQILISAPLLREDSITPVEALSIQKEIDEIVRVIEDLPNSIQLEIRVDIATSETLHRILTSNPKPLIIHFIGHGMTAEDEIALLLENNVGLARPFLERELRFLLDGAKEPPCQLVLLNACHSGGLAKALVNSGVPHVIAINASDQVLDIAARCFAKNFYRLLLNENTVLDSFLQGRKGVLINDELKKLFNPKTYQQDINLEEYFKFELLPNSNSHDELIQLKFTRFGNIRSPKWENTNLAQEDITFVGRRQEIYQRAVDLEQHSCLALHGMGGMGKTVLAKAAGRWQHERKRYRDGVWFINLRSISTLSDARLKLVNELEDLTDSQKKQGQQSNRNLAKVLEDSHRLLILDDLDQLLEKNPDDLVDFLNQLRNCRRLKLLLTSRKDIPTDVFHHSCEILTMNQAEAIETFKKYASKNKEWLASNSQSQQDFTEIIEFLDGYPLPLKLAASYLQEKRCDIRRLKNKIWQALEGTHRRNRSKQTSLTITLDLSYQLLPPAAKDMFLRLAIFPGGLSEELVISVWGEESLEMLETLLDHSMAEKVEDAKDWRVRLPEPARQYAETKQIDSPMERYAPQILEYFYNFVQEITEQLEQRELSLKEAQQKIYLEQSNLNHFLNWGYEYEQSQANVSRSGRITLLLKNYWQENLSKTEFLQKLDSAIKGANRNRDKLTEADLYKLKGNFYQTSQELEDALECYHRAVELYQVQTETLKAAETYIELGKIQQSQKKWEEAISSYEKALTKYQLQQCQSGIAQAKNLIRYVQIIKNLLLLTFETVFVNKNGKIIERKPCQVYYYDEPLGKNVEPVRMIYIPEGEFMMGSPENEKSHHNTESPQYRVKVSQFFISQTPVTQAQWRAIANLPQIRRELKLNPSYFQGDNNPVERVNWYDGIEFCARLSHYTGRDYRLPSETEWEYACRGGTTTPFHFGETITTKLANYNGDYTYADESEGKYQGKTTSVCTFPANLFGLYDMHGNVWEWCLDPWHENYNDAPIDGNVWDEQNKNDNYYQNIVKSSKTLLTDKRLRVRRGGSWFSNPDNCRSAYRYNRIPGLDNFNIGFRVVVGVPRT